MTKTKTKTKIIIIGLIILISGILSWALKPSLTEAGKVVFKKNVVVRAFFKPTLNGTMTTTTQSFIQATGGVDDYNSSQTIPADAYTASWLTCSAGNNWCNTGHASSTKKDLSTGLIWTDWLENGTTTNWFYANNCAPPGSAENPGACAAHGNIGCQCVKLTSSKTGCESLGDGWRLPHQKELIQAYIDGSWANLFNPGYGYWSATTLSNDTLYAWYVYLYNGYTNVNVKSSDTSYRIRCVRP